MDLQLQPDDAALQARARRFADEVLQPLEPVAVKLCRGVKACAVTRSAEIRLSTAASASRRKRSLMRVFTMFLCFMNQCEIPGTKAQRK